MHSGKASAPPSKDLTSCRAAAPRDANVYRKGLVLQESLIHAATQAFVANIIDQAQWLACMPLLWCLAKILC